MERTLYFFLVNCFAIYLFTSGFFLTRIQLPNESSCERNPSPFLETSKDSCWMDPAFSKAILVVIDALRLDFVTFDPNKANYESYFENKMRNIHERLEKHPKNARLFRFLSDAPTTTMQRIKGLTTGGFPTFMDVSKNFASDTITEDNLIWQAKKVGKKLVFMGDDTWMSLFPESFNISFPFPSFVVKDLHTVDNGVSKHLLPTLRQNDSWDILIAHFLGVDHVGHTFGPSHPEMSSKLQQMDKMVEEIIQEMSEDTILFVMGDHGMTSDGNHGGASEEEVTASLFVYSPKHIFSESQSAEEIDTFAQIDFVPTFSLLLGNAIPFANLGKLISPLFLGNSIEKIKEKGTKVRVEDVRRYMKALHLNCWQVFNYIQEYAKTSSNEFPSEKLVELGVALKKSNRKFMRYNEAYTKIEELVNVCESYEKFHQLALEMCQNLWTRFNLASMTKGLVLLFFSCITLTFQIMGGKSEFEYSKYSITLGAFFGIFLALLTGSSSFTESIFWSCLFSLLRALLPSLEHSQISLSTISEKISKSNLVDSFSLVCFFLHGVSLFSNSFIESEHTVVHFLGVSILLVFCVTSNKLKFRNNLLSLICFYAISNVFGLSGAKQEESLTTWNFLFLSIFPTLFQNMFYSAIYNHTTLSNSNTKEREDYSKNLLFHFLIPSNNLLLVLFRVLQHLKFNYLILSLPRILLLSFLLCWILLSTVKNRLSKTWIFLLINSQMCMLLLGPKSAWLVFLFLLLTHFLEKSAPTKSSASISLLLYLLCLHLFYSSGHFCSFSSLNMDVAFIFLENADVQIFAAALIILETFTSFLLVIPSLSILSLPREEPTNSSVLFLLFSLSGLLTSIFVFIERRHLMVWRVFAPKFIFDSCFVLASGTLILLNIFTSKSKAKPF